MRSVTGAHSGRWADFSVAFLYGFMSVFGATFNYHRTPHYRTGDEVRPKPPFRPMTSASKKTRVLKSAIFIDFLKPG
jgi:hypothetical protein